MIELLFKGKTKITGKWVEGNGIIQGQDGISHARWVDICDDKVRYEVIPETVGRFTGLTDKNKIKVFEWDIVKVNGVANAVVIWNNDEACFAFDYGADGKPLIVDLVEERSIEVIGNKWDNPEC